MPAGEEGDPEATAPVEVSSIGIELIEMRRRQRLRTQRMMAIGVVCVGIGTIAYLWHLVAGLGTLPPQPQPPRASIESVAPKSASANLTPPAPKPPSAPAQESAPSARGIQRQVAPRSTGTPRAGDD